MSGSNSLFDLSNNKKFGIIGGIAAVIALAAVIGFSGSMDQSDTITSSNTGSISTQQLMINVDESSYKLSDIISVYGTVNSPNGKLVELSVENTSGDKIWKEYVTIKSNGKFSTLVIAGGYGWDNSGDYLLKAQHNNLENEIEFSFNAL